RSSKADARSSARRASRSGAAPLPCGKCRPAPSWNRRHRANPPPRTTPRSWTSTPPCGAGVSPSCRAAAGWDVRPARRGCGWSRRSGPSLRRRRPELLDELGQVIEDFDRSVSFLRAVKDRARGALARSERFDAVRVVRSCCTLESRVLKEKKLPLEFDSTLETLYLKGDPNALY